MDGDIADPLPGQGEALGIGKDQDAVAVKFHDAGDLNAVVHDVSIGFIGDEINSPAVIPGFSSHDGGQTLQRGHVINPAGRVVRRIDQHCLGIFIDGRLDGGQIQGKVFPGGDSDGNASAIVHIETVFDEKGGGNEDLVAGIEDGFKDDIERPPGSDGHDDLLRRYGHALLPEKVIRHGPPRLGITGIGHIGMLPRNIRGGHFPERLAELLRWLHVGVAQTEIIDIPSPEFLLEPYPLFEHPSYPRRLRDKPLDLFCHGHSRSPLNNVYFCPSGNEAVPFFSRAERSIRRAPWDVNEKA